MKFDNLTAGYDFRESISAELKEARLWAKVTQKELSKRTGISRSYISKVENAQVAYSIDIVGRIVDALEIPGEFYDWKF